MFLVIFSSHDLPTTEKVLKFMQMRAWYINLRSAVWVVGTESPRLTARWPNVTLEHAVVAFLQSLQKMTLKELLGLAPGGTGGRGGPSASEDQLAAELVGADVTVDAGWHGRSSGHSYSSNGGTVAMLDGETSKCLAYSVHCRHCKKCDEWRKAHPPPALPG